MNWSNSLPFVFGAIALIAAAALWLQLLLRPSSSQLLRLLGRPADRPIAIWGLADLMVVLGLLLTSDFLAQSITAPPPADAVQEENLAGVTSSLGWLSLQATNEVSKDSQDESSATAQEETSAEANSEPPLADPVTMSKRMLTLGFARLIAFMVMLAYFFLRYFPSPREIGFPPGSLVKDINLGLMAALMIIPPVLLLQVLLTFLVPYEHSTKASIEASGDLRVAAAAFFSAGLIAPIVEEFVYRFFLQGWLTRIAVAGQEESAQVMFGGRNTEQNELRGQDAAPQDAKSKDKNRRTDKKQKQRPLPLWPVLASSGLFALAHLGQGLAPVPLFFLAVGMGILFQRTQRILPCIIVHMALNLWSVSLILFTTLTG